MTLITILLLALVLTAIALWKANFVMGVVAAGMWVVLVAFIRVNPLGGIAVGSNVENMLFIVFAGAASGVLIYTASNRNRERNSEIRAWGSASKSLREKFQPKYEDRPVNYTNMSETDYRAKVHRALHPRRRH